MTETPGVPEPEGTWAKLRSRKVVQWSLAYVAGAWALLQAIDFLADAFDWPGASKRFATLASLVGLPIAIVVAWYHGERGQQRISAAELALLATLCLLGGSALWFYGKRVEPAPTVTGALQPGASPSAGSTLAGERPAIAVLPFDNRSRLEDDAFFVDGIHDDILTQLSKIGALTVIARTSVEQFRDTTLPVKVIAEQLGVGTILEGGVQRAGDRVRINVQLIDAASEGHLWAETYDRELTAANIFTIQSEVAAAIAAALKATLSPAEEARSRAVPTRNLEAWEAYQLGRRRMARRTSADLVDAERFFVKAIDLDPEFALAYVGLADTLGLQIDYGGIPAGEALERAGAAVARALALDPDLAEGATSSAWLAFQSGEFAEAEAGFHRAIELNPNYATAYHWSSRLFGAQGRYEEALRYAERAVLLDPLSVIINVNFGISLERVSRFEDALAAYHRAIEIEPSMPNSYLRIGALHDFAFGRLDLAMPWFEKAARIDPGNPDYSMALAGLYLDLGDDRQARLWLEETLQRSASYSPVHAVTALLLLYDGKQARMLGAATRAVEIEPRNSLALRLLRDYDLQRGDYAKIRARYASAFPELFEPAVLQVDATNYSAAVDLAPVLHETGEHELADALLALSESLLRGTPRMGWMGYRITDSQIYALRGRQGEALTALRAAEQDGWRFLWRYHRDHDPSFASIRDKPAFRSIFADIEADMARQRAGLAARPADAPLAPVQPPASQSPGF